MDESASPEPTAAPGDPVPVDLRHYVDFDLERPAATRVYATDALALDLICLEPRQALSARTLGRSTVVYTVLAGRAWVVTDDAEVTLEALQAVLVPPAAPHGIRNDSADPLILQAVVSPPDAGDADGVAPAGDSGDIAATAGNADGAAPAGDPGAAPQVASGQPKTPGRVARPRFLDRLRRGLGG